VIGGIGAFTIGAWQYSRHVAAVIAALAYVSVQPRWWSRSIRNSFARQILLVGVESVPFVLLLGILVGAVAVVEAAALHGMLRPELLDTLLVVIIARELGPLLANLIIIIKGGSATITDLAGMKISGEIHQLESQGRHPLTELLMPRMCAAMVSAFCLTILLTAVAFLTGFLGGTAIGHVDISMQHFMARMILEEIEPTDWVVIVVKSIVPAMVQSVICATAGLRVNTLRDVTPAVRGGLSRSLAALFAIAAITSVIAYA
jgi:phospholipid/cholesterol/gamma-HCH transport system permease protein